MEDESARVIVEELVKLAAETLALAEQYAEENKALLKHAEEDSSRNQTGIQLTKVAAAEFDKVADKLSQTGAFPRSSKEQIANYLRENGTAAHLEILEKLASRAVFAVDDADVTDGDLVEKLAFGPGDPESRGLTGRTAMWRRCIDEAEEELAAI